MGALGFLRRREPAPELEGEARNGPPGAPLQAPGVPALAAPPVPAAERPGGIRIKPGDKVLILGQNGTGKSVLAQALVASWQLGPLVVLDTKGDDPAALVPNATVCYTAEDVVRHLPGRVIYRPSITERRDRRPGDPRNLRPLWARWETVCLKVRELADSGVRPILLSVKELRETCTEQSIGPEWRELFTAGRSHGITLVVETQRPQRVALEARSEAQHVVCFSLTDASARAEAAALLGDPNQPEMERLIRQRALPRDFRWLYRGPDLRLSLHDPIAWP